MKQNWKAAKYNLQYGVLWEMFCSTVNLDDLKMNGLKHAKTPELSFCFILTEPHQVTLVPESKVKKIVISYQNSKGFSSKFRNKKHQSCCFTDI